MTNPAIQSERKKETKVHPELSASRKGWWKTVLELAILLPVSLLALEGFLHWAGVGEEEFLEPDPVLGVKHIAGKQIVWRLEGFSQESFSSLGMRDLERTVAKAPGVKRIALLGDSATEGLQVPFADTYGAVLEKMLREKGEKVEVLNFGCSSYSNGQELLQLRHEVAKFRPDLVVLMYNRGDFIENIRDPRTLKAEPRPYFYLSGKDGSLVQDNEVMEANKKLFEPQPVLQFLRRNSCIYGILSHLNLTLSLNEPFYTKLRNSLLKKLDRKTVERDKNYRQTYPIQNVWKVTETIFTEIGQECRSQGAKLAIVCFPNIVGDAEYARQIKTLAGYTSDHGFGYLDLTPCYTGAVEPKKNFLKYHFSSQGHDLAARKIAPLVADWTE